MRSAVAGSDSSPRVPLLAPWRDDGKEHGGGGPAMTSSALLHRDAALVPRLEVQADMSPRLAESIRELPDLMSRIREMGLESEYTAFRARYLGWRKGETRGARGEPTATELVSEPAAAANRGWGFWYPNIEEWQFRRTISYWIAVAFFEGSIFFTISSFLYNYPGRLGDSYGAVTLCGYIAGKVCYFVCTWFMCIEIINLHTRSTQPDGEGESTFSPLGDGEEVRFYYWPFRYKQAFKNLQTLGLGPWPYYAAVTYFLGVLLFTVGLVVEIFPVLSLAAQAHVTKATFVIGSILFVLGGLAECIENKTFTSLNLDKGWFGALFNLLGSAGFLIGSVVMQIFPFWSNIWFGIGSILFLFGSSLQIIMWKDEQFGLTFLAVLNRLGGPDGRPVVASESDAPKEVALTVRGVIMVHLYCLQGALSIYMFNVELQRTMDDPTIESMRRAFNVLLPAVISHMLLILSSAAVVTPKSRPYKQLYIMMRWVFLAMLLNSTCLFMEFLQDKFHLW
eukprot:TRINITY_DN31316_c0_g1_i1.p1 TRINITY_DN31316_c0_g1~~TRINITY_DN31316_c0_g1_i1.p1  ORF type:complete len:507 (+),score=59.61 TRINITY_DN31316_c0_g1_i1:99-1619(+)